MDMVMAYQPIVRQAPDEQPMITGYEALWRPPSESPGAAWKRLERSGQVVAMDLACLEAAWTQRPAVSLNDPLHANVFPVTLETARFWQWVDRFATGAPLILEIVEDPWTPETARQLQRLRTLGFSVALDDVDPGTRWWDLLEQAHPVVLKLETGFARTVRGRRRLPELLGWARDHGARVVAEGVETAQDVSTYQELGVQEFQGFFFGRPVRPALAASG